MIPPVIPHPEARYRIVYHGTTAAAAKAIQRMGQLCSAGEPHVYVSTDPHPAGYGDGTVVCLLVREDRLRLDDEFPSGRRDFAIATRRPGGCAKVNVVGVNVDLGFAESRDGHRSGLPVRLEIAHNTESAGYHGTRFQQHIEPAGMYVTEAGDYKPDLPQVQYGIATVRCPLVMHTNTGSGGLYDKYSWKQRLVDAFGGPQSPVQKRQARRRGRVLADKIKAAGFDAILTVGRHGHLLECVLLAPDVTWY